jgi:pimeloyl-ACP methyl ester carboxylesterase
MAPRSIFFPGWAMPPDKSLTRRFLPEELEPIDNMDYGFFAGSGNFDFRDPESEILKLSQSDAEYRVAIGYSMGSQFAIRLAAGSQKIKALIIIAGFAKFAESEDNPGGQKLGELRAMAQALLKTPSRVLREFYGLMSAAVKTAFETDSFIPNPTRLAQGINYLAKCDVSDVAGNVRVPSIVIAGDKDLIVKPFLSEKLGKMIPGCRFALLNDSGHDLPFTRYKELRTIISNFLNEQNII